MFSFIPHPHHRSEKCESPQAVFLLLFVIAVRCFDNLALPAIYSRFLFTTSTGFGPSMRPMLQEGDQVIVNGLVYHLASPQVGDVVGLTLPAYVSHYSESSVAGVMKRIVAAGRETVYIQNGSVFVNGKRRDFNINGDAEAPSPGDVSIYSFGEDKNPYLKYGVHEPYLVPEGHYFLLGDNPSYSVDSRCFGAVHRQSIVGKAVKIYWPARRIGDVR